MQKLQFLGLNKFFSTHSRYDRKQNQWSDLSNNIDGSGILFRLVYVKPYLYALGVATHTSSGATLHTLTICRYNFVKASWEKCLSYNSHVSYRLAAGVGVGVGVVDGCIYLVGLPISTLSTIRCFNPETQSLKTV